MYDYDSSSRHGAEIARISPLFNRAIMFETTNNWHGVPDTLSPEGVTRNAIGIFYLSSELSIETENAKKKRCIPHCHLRQMILRLKILLDVALIQIFVSPSTNSFNDEISFSCY